MTKLLIATFIMAAVTYIPRVLPITLMSRRIESKFIHSFLNYVPFAVLGAMIFPDILDSTGHTISALFGMVIALIAAYYEKGLMKVAVCAIVAVYICESFM